MYFSKPVVLNWINQQIAEQKLSLKVDKLRINPFTFSVAAQEIQLSYQNKPVLLLKQLYVNIELWPLFENHVRFEDVQVDGVKLQSEWKNNDLEISGWSPRMFLVERTSNSNGNNIDSNKQRFIFSSQRVVLNNLNLRLQAEQNYHWQIEHLSFTGMEIRGDEIHASVALKGKLNNHLTNMSFTVSNAPAKTTVDVKSMDVGVNISDYSRWLPNNLVSDGVSNVNFIGVINRIGKQWHVSTGQLTTRTQNLLVGLPVQGEASELSLNAFNIDASFDNLIFDSDKQAYKGIIVIESDFKGFNWKLKKSGDVLAEISSGELENGRVTLNSNSHVQAQSLTVNEGVLSQRISLPTIKLHEESIAPLTVFRKIHATGLNVANTNLSIEQVLADLELVNIYKSKQNSIENWVLSKEPSSYGMEESLLPTAKYRSNEMINRSFGIIMKRIKFVGDPQVTLNDYSLAEPVVQKGIVTELIVRDINSNSPENKAEFEVAGTIGKRGQFAVKGDVFPFQKLINIKALGSINAINLVPYSLYVQEAINHRVTQGVISADFTLSLVDQMLEGDISTEITAVKLQQVNASNNTAVNKSVIPISIAIDQLMNEKGIIKVSLPFRGHIDDPEFNSHDVITLMTTKALKIAAKNYLMHAFLPYASIIKVGVLAGDSLFELSIEDLPYEPQQIDLTSTQLVFASNLTKIIDEQKYAYVVICPVVTNDEQIDLSSQSQRVQEDSVQLKLLGQQRLEKFTEHLIEQLAVDSKRIIHCDTQIDSKKGAIPRLVFKAK